MPFRTMRGCPECGTELSHYRTGNYSYETCSSCCGMWIPSAVLRKMIADMNPEAPDALESSDHQRRWCPDCSAPMKALRLFYVAVDICVARDHGVWFDRDELRQVLEAVGTGAQSERAANGEFQSLLHDFFRHQRAY